MGVCLLLFSLTCKSGKDLGSSYLGILGLLSIYSIHFALRTKTFKTIIIIREGKNTDVKILEKEYRKWSLKMVIENIFFL